MTAFLGGLWPRRLTLQTHLILMILALVLIQFAISWFVVSGVVSDVLREQIGQRALQTALAVSEIPTIRRDLAAADNSGEIQFLSDTLRRKIGAEFIVVGDHDGIRYSHPVPDRLGKPFVGGDIGPVLNEGRSYVSQAVGTLGPSIRGMAPIFGGEDDLIGFVSVGYLVQDVQDIIRAHLERPFLYVSVLMVVGILWAAFVARRLKRMTLGLEPSEITALYLQRGAVLEAIREGVVATDGEGRVRLANRAALHAAEVDDVGTVLGQPARRWFPEVGLDEVMATGQAIADEERPVRGRDMIVNIVPVASDGKMQGAVASFRPKDEVDRIARELSRVHEYIELLRVQSHEYSNKLHTVAGLIQIDAHQEALDLIVKESSGYQDVIRLLHRAVPHPMIAAIILGKFSRAREIRVDLRIDPESRMTDVPETIEQDKIVTVVGNLLDNAFDAVLPNRPGERWVHLSFTDLGTEIVFEIEDNGPGIPPEDAERIFEKGMSGKGGERRGRGLGLYLVRKSLDDLGGYVTVGDGESGGAVFTVAIPKHRSTIQGKEPETCGPSGS